MQSFLKFGLFVPVRYSMVKSELFACEENISAEYVVNRDVVLSYCKPEGTKVEKGVRSTGDRLLKGLYFRGCSLLDRQWVE